MVGRTDESRDSDGQNGQRDVLRDIGLPVDEVIAFTEFHEVSECKADKGANDDAEDDLV